MFYWLPLQDINPEVNQNRTFILSTFLHIITYTILCTNYIINYFIYVELCIIIESYNRFFLIPNPNINLYSVKRLQSVMGKDPLSSDLKKPYWQKDSFSPCSKLKILSISLIMLLAISVTVALYFQCSDANPLAESTLCNKQECINSAADILRSIDSDSNPCENFYKFSCGNYIRSSYPTRETKSVENSMQNLMIMNMKTLLEDNYQDTRGNPRFMQLAQDLYSSCLDKTSIDRNVDDEIEKVLQNFDWYKNFKNNQSVEDIDWALVSEQFKKVGLPYENFERSKRDQVEYVVSKVLEYAKQFKNVPLEPRAIPCTKIVIESLPEATGSMYVRSFSSKKTKKVAMEIASKIKRQLIDTLKNTKWLDAQSSNAALKRAEGIKLQVAYPEEFLDDALMSDLYKNVGSGKNFMRAKLALNVLNRNIKLERNWTRFGDVLKTENQYDPETNTIHIYAGSLQEPLFVESRPQYLNYGSIGWSIGRNLISAFDIKNLSRHEEDFGFWTNEAKKMYGDRLNCIVDQYNLRKIYEDTEGLRESYLAYKEYTKGIDNPEKRLPGLNYSPEQTFWISAATSKCVKYSAEDLFDKNLNDLPNEHKVNGALKNSVQFAEDFNCEVGSLMNPEEKCIVF